MSGMLPPRSRDDHVQFSLNAAGDLEVDLSPRSSPLQRMPSGLGRLSMKPQHRPRQSAPPMVPQPRHNCKFQSLDLRPPYNARERADRHHNGLSARRERYLREFNHYILAILIGVLLGILGVVFHQAYARLASLRFSTYFTYAAQGDLGVAYLVNSAISLAYLVIPCGSVLMYPTLAGSGIPGILAFLNGINIPSLLTLPAFALKFVGSIFSVASGLALGPEGPAIHYGGAFGSLFCTFWYKVVDRQMRGEQSNGQMRFEHRRQHFTAMGAAASVAALFRAPIAGTMFVIEEAANHVAVRDVWATFVACVTATATVYSVEAALGAHGTFIFNIALGESCEGYTYFEYFFFAIVGVVCGCCGSFFNFLQDRLNTFRASRLNRTRMLRAVELLAIVLVTSGVAVFLPMVFPCEDNTAQALLTRTSGCLEKPILATVVHASIHKEHDGHEEISHLLQPGMFGIQYSKSCIYALDYDTCRSLTGVPFQNCSIPQRPYQESSCHLPGMQDFTASAPESSLDYCCGFDKLKRFQEWVDSNGTSGFVYGHRQGDKFVVTEPYLHMEFLDEASHNGEHFCEAPEPGEPPQYNPAALLMTTPLGSDVANVLFTQGLPSLIPAYTLAAYFAVYFCLACITSGSAVPGGLIVPFVVCGGSLGRLSALCFEWMLEHRRPSAYPEWLNSAWDPLMGYMESWHYQNPSGHRGFEVFPTVPDPGTYAIVGAASFMAATGRLSMFFTVLMLEATGYISYSLPISIGAIVATWTGNCFNHGLYHILMHVAKLPYLPTEASVDQEAMQVKDLYDEGYVCHTVEPDADIYKWKNKLDETSHNAFPVVDMDGYLQGLILRQPLERFVDDHLEMLRLGTVDERLVWHFIYKKIEKEMDAAPVVVHDTDPVDMALKIFSRMRLRHMVVLRHESEAPVFLLTRHDLHPHAVTHGMTVMMEEPQQSSGSPSEGGETDEAARTHHHQPGDPSGIATDATEVQIELSDMDGNVSPSTEPQPSPSNSRAPHQSSKDDADIAELGSIQRHTSRQTLLSGPAIHFDLDDEQAERSLNQRTTSSEPSSAQMSPRGTPGRGTWEGFRRALNRDTSLKFVY